MGRSIFMLSDEAAGCLIKELCEMAVKRAQVDVRDEIDAALEGIDSTDMQEVCAKYGLNDISPLTVLGNALEKGRYRKALRYNLK
jgi:hypothetical protein